jgi:hypothetical protein
VKFHRLRTLLLLLLATTSTAQGTHPVPPGVRQADQIQGQLEKSSVPPMIQRPPIELAKLRRDADELAALAQSIPSAVDQTAKGILPRDLNEKLKRIEKLAKELRSQVSR